MTVVYGTVFSEGDSVHIWNGDAVWAKPTSDQRIQHVVIVGSSVDTPDAGKITRRPVRAEQVSAVFVNDSR